MNSPFAPFVLYNSGTIVSLISFVPIIASGGINIVKRDPNVQLTVSIVVSACGTLMRVPFLLSENRTRREFYLFLGFMCLELIACILNLIAFASLLAYLLASVFGGMSCICILLLLCSAENPG